MIVSAFPAVIFHFREGTLPFVVQQLFGQTKWMNDLSLLGQRPQMCVSHIQNQKAISVFDASTIHCITTKSIRGYENITHSAVVISLCILLLI